MRLEGIWEELCNWVPGKVLISAGIKAIRR